MKYTISALLIVVAVSCTKTKTTFVNVPVHDTTVVTVHDTVTTSDTLDIHDTLYYARHLMGNWTNVNASYPKLTITLDSLTWHSSIPVYMRYVASADTLYQAYSNNTIYSQFVYSISGNGDTLFLKDAHISTAPQQILTRDH